LSSTFFILNDIALRHSNLCDGKFSILSSQFIIHNSSFINVVPMIETLRNNLAHAQDSLTTDWVMIVRLAEDLDRVLD